MPTRTAISRSPLLPNLPGGTTFDLVDDGTNTQNTKAFTDVDPGTYNISEVVPTGWAVDSITCDTSDYNSQRIPVRLLPCMAATMSPAPSTMWETTGTIIIEKQTVPGGGFDFGFTDNIEAPFNFTLDDGQSKTFVDVLPGAYTVTEVDPGSVRLPLRSELR
ncbi:MAG: hypothetical protein R3C44_15415 [Chloroflexota bacterium]